jgi:tetratricopeptide (TPR) repeat protein
MFRRYFLPVLGSVAFVLSISLAAFAQNGQLRGHVTLKQADGTVVPAADAAVDVFRTDLTTEYHLKASKRGEFVHAGLPFGGDYIIGVSMPGAQPTYLPGVKVGRDIDYAIEMQPGDGSRLTIAQIKAAQAGSGTSSGGETKESAEDKAKRAELMKKNEEIKASNAKADSSNTIIQAAFKAGNEALNAKQYDLAISKYDEGLAADPEHPGAASLLTNKTMALNSRAVEKFNAAVKQTDEAAKSAGIDSAKKDWTAANETGAKAVAMQKAIVAAADQASAPAAKNNLYFALVARSKVAQFYVVKVDPTKADEGVVIFEEYIAAEPDAAKKSTAQHNMAQMLFDANDYEKAKPAYEKILAQTPDDAESLKNMGLILYNLGFIKEAEGKKDEAKASYQMAANYLQQFVDKAPDGPMKTDAQDILKNMKENQNVQAEKGSTPAHRRAKP